MEVPQIAGNAVYAPSSSDSTIQTPKECPLATPSACRARITFDRAGPRVVLRSKHSALWAVAVASNDSPANRPPLLAVLCPCGAGAKALFQKACFTAKPKGGADAEGIGGRGVHGGGRSGEPKARTGGAARSPPAGLWAVRRSRSKRPLLIVLARYRKPLDHRYRRDF